MKLIRYERNIQCILMNFRSYSNADLLSLSIKFEWNNHIVVQVTNEKNHLLELVWSLFRHACYCNVYDPCTFSLPFLMH